MVPAASLEVPEIQSPGRRNFTFCEASTTHAGTTPAPRVFESYHLGWPDASSPFTEPTFSLSLGLGPNALDVLPQHCGHLWVRGLL